ncbi:hypothetical protein [Rhodobacter calidifons]|uniref:Uncharacterized protein n=1 Tax=Rhodobacter calidifons TaxID=2715277 RepID=A0ABX0G1Y8_9RHOB|nr:hypothetical protein [Rhodobacter calidifons]NHB75156.1 hypothetical protein [Rhodobacter calidifons]
MTAIFVNLARRRRSRLQGRQPWRIAGFVGCSAAGIACRSGEEAHALGSSFHAGPVPRRNPA